MISFDIAPRINRRKQAVFFPFFKEDAKKSLRKAFRGLSSVQKRAVRKTLESGRFPASGVLPVFSNDAPVFIQLLGEKKKFTTREAREIGESLHSTAAKFEVEQAAALSGVLKKDQWKAFQEGIVLGLYEFVHWKGAKKSEDSKKKNEKEKKLSHVQIVGPKDASWEKQLKTLFEAVKYTKDLINEPPNVATPSYLEKIAREITKNLSHVSIEVLREKELIKLGCGGILAVGLGSEEESRLLLLKYSGGKKEAPLALVGKGVTYDSGGLNTKGQYMRTMKQDLGGAATVLGAFFALAKTKVKKNIIAAIPAVENLISAKSYKPDDVLRMYNGKTVEITNTDAEGRLILADALAYVEKRYSPRAIVDMATLTGGCVYAVGNDIVALLGKNSQMVAALLESSKSVDEPLWELPIHDRYEQNLESKIADIVNASGKMKAMVIEGALFLQHFVTEKTPWCHLDIASVTFDENLGMATGRNVRLLWDFVEKY
ncbi:leucyl aminopeptidase family protein [Candidatus Peregrinibacteria bacterium]|nr:leucyl aminopeptidase family protein [Candidatus Peregrinibacteria bacterium]